MKYLEDASPETYENLITSPGFPDEENFGLLYTSRLHRSILYQDTAWIYNIYSLSINNTEPIEDIEGKLSSEMNRIDKEYVYISDNFVLFK